jgi:hypothetical protein
LFLLAADFVVAARSLRGVAAARKHAKAIVIS